MGLQCHYSKFTSKFKGTSIYLSIYHFSLLFGIGKHPALLPVPHAVCLSWGTGACGRCVWQGAREVPELSSSSRLSSPLLSPRGEALQRPAPGREPLPRSSQGFPGSPPVSARFYLLPAPPRESSCLSSLPPQASERDSPRSSAGLRFPSLPKGRASASPASLAFCSWVVLSLSPSVFLDTRPKLRGESKDRPST